MSYVNLGDVVLPIEHLLTQTLIRKVVISTEGTTDTLTDVIPDSELPTAEIPDYELARALYQPAGIDPTKPRRYATTQAAYTGEFGTK